MSIRRHSLRSRQAIAAAFGLSILAALAMRAQVAIAPGLTVPPTAPPKNNLRADANLVLVPVTVCDPKNRPVTSLEKEHFRVFDNNVEQTLTAFAMDDAPVVVGLVFDVSGSMGAKLRKSREAAAAFFDTANPEDEFFLVEFNDQPKLAVPLTRSSERIETRLLFSESKGRTALLDAVILAIHELKKSAMSRKALLIISDGGDNCSRYSRNELKNIVRESDALIYAIGIYGGAATPEEVDGPELLSAIAEQTGGRHFPAEAYEMPDIAAKIGVELRNRYMLGYSPAATQRDGRYHPVQVKIVPPRGLPALRAFWRHGYYAPSE